ncbi:glycosyltransferase family 39 protein [Chroococcus sp. FPU101]|uniref:glycosyltransferase family 39 protein n=1 Tax=Chroococcus sp. FPU101 TaxID=1974212 RepID=UPI001A8D4B12|nr:glycosyltransferase family 39 protein [Chroococcus sp. FPU101]GFE69601.1 hypothetical protein CFPU101_22110 [Chroococcus sp. FPU101]
MQIFLEKKIEKYGIYTLNTILLLSIFLLVFRPVIEIPYKIFKNYNEGWNAYQTFHAFHGIALYPKIESYISNNYPPLSFYIVGALGQLIGDNIIAGRIISFVSLILVSFFIGLSIYYLSKSKYLSLYSGLLFIGYITGHYYTYIAMNDPQILGHAIQISGLYTFIVFIDNNKNKLLLLSLLLLSIGVCIKQNLISLPLSIIIWLFIYKRKSYYFSIIVLGILLITLGLTCYFIYGFSFYENFFSTARVYSIFSAIKSIEYFITPLLLFFGIAIIAIMLDYSNKTIHLLSLYILISTIFGIFISGGEGVSFNAIFDTIIGLCIMSGIAIHNLVSIRDYKPYGLNRLSWIQITAMLILFLSVLITIPEKTGGLMLTIQELNNRKTMALEDINFVKSFDEPIICENLALCYWANKSFTVDVFNLGQKLKTKKSLIDKNELIKNIENHSFSLIQLNVNSNLLPEDIQSKINENYQIRRYSSINNNKNVQAFLTPIKS